MPSSSSSTEIQTNRELICELIADLYLQPRSAILKWSQVTNQTAQVRIAYPGQHLASLVSGIPGTGTAARGNDLADGSEIKSCSRADQLGKCKECGGGVLPHQEQCPTCNSSNIDRKTDSHWIFSIKSKQELDQYLSCPRILLVLFDRMVDGSDVIRSRIWEIWPSSARHLYFRWFVEDYWENNYLYKLDKGLTPAPLNLHPLQFDFYMMNPVCTFEARTRMPESIEKSATFVPNPTDIIHWIEPNADRDDIDVDIMPVDTVRPKRLMIELIEQVDDEELGRCIRENISISEVRDLTVNSKTEEIVSKFIGLTESVRLNLPFPEKSVKETPSSYVRN